MPNTIANITVPGPVIQFNNKLYLDENGQYDPHTLNIPCGVNAWVDDIQHWFVPIKDFGIVNTEYCEIVPAVGDNPPGSPPTPDSLLVLRIRDKYKPYFTWWVACTIADYYASCQTCCGATFVPIPAPVLPVIVPCQQICLDASGVLKAVFGAPADAGTFTAHGQYNGEVIQILSGAATLADLVILMNNFWGVIGSPAGTFVWTSSGNTVIATGGNEGDSLCVIITSS